VAEANSVKWDNEEWSPAEQAILEWIQTALAGHKLDVFWRDRPHGNIQAPYIELALGTEVALGHDDVELEPGEEEDDDPAIVITGNREVMLSMQCRTRDQSTFRQARKYMGKLRQSLEHPRYVQILEAGGLGVVDAEPLRPFPVNDGSRVESVVLLEVKFSLIQEFRDEQADKEVGFVDTVSVGVQLDGETPVTPVDIDVS
jgi:hypothetical protein